MSGYTTNDMGVPLTETFVNEYAEIPEHMRRSLIEYVTLHREVGGWLRAVLQNDLKNGVLKADEINLPLLRVYVLWLTWNAPSGCWGSPAAYNEWTFRDVHEQLCATAGAEIAHIARDARDAALRDCAENEALNNN